MSFVIEKDWTTAAGLRAVVLGLDRGHRCGYVGVPKGHPLHGVEYSQPTTWLRPLSDDDAIGKRGVLSALVVAASDEPDRRSTPEAVFDVHGSLTFSGGGKGYPVESDLWWFGYDCAHAWDLKDRALMSPEAIERENGYGWEWDGQIRTLDYCMGECESLARQIVSKVQP